MGNELRLATGAFQWHHSDAGGIRGDCGAVITPHEVKAQVQTSRGAGGGQDLSVIDVENIGIDRNTWITTGQLVRGAPVCRGAPAVKQSGRRQYERTAADGSDPAAPLSRAPNGADDGFRYRCQRIGHAGNNQGIRFSKRTQTPVWLHRERTGRHVSLDPAHTYVVTGAIVSQPNPSEYLAWRGQVERNDTGQDEDRNSVHGTEYTCSRRQPPMARIKRFVSFLPLARVDRDCEDGVMDIVMPMAIGILYALLTSLFREPNRQNFNAIMIAGAGAAYLNGGLGVWEFAFAAVVTVLAYHGLKSYRWIGIGWVLHTLWDVTHHLFGTPIVPFVPSSSAGCAICDIVIALWCFAGAPSPSELQTRLMRVLCDRVA